MTIAMFGLLCTAVLSAAMAMLWSAHPLFSQWGLAFAALACGANAMLVVFWIRSAYASVSDIKPYVVDALARGPMAGTPLRQLVERLSGRRVDIATFYIAVDSMIRSGEIVRAGRWERDVPGPLGATRREVRAHYALAMPRTTEEARAWLNDGSHTLTTDQIMACLALIPDEDA